MPRASAIGVAAVCLAAALPIEAAPEDDRRIAELEAQLRAAQARVAELESTLQTLAADVAALKGPGPREPDRSEAGSSAAAIVAADLGGDERDEELTGRPELFVQVGYAANPIDGATRDDAPTNFMLHRMESRWSGRVSDRLGLGFELQYQPVADGASEELVNDAFVEYYASEAVTLRVGQFVTPFGFDVQQSSSVREAPERAMFAGYFFPGQRDRGAIVRAELGGLAAGLAGTTLSGGLLNGNRFFDDNNDDLNVVLRLRKVFSERPLALGVSWQSGEQLLPPNITAGDRATTYGLDAQWLVGKLGVRAEYVRGDMPSTLLGLEPEFAQGFAPGEKTWGAAAFFGYELSANDEIYWRWDRLDNDPVTRANVRAFNVGYLRRIGASSRIGVDYQWKDEVTYNDDELNARLSIRWNLVYE